MSKQVIYIDELYHHGVKGMKWGHRKDYTNGVLNSRGKAHEQYRAAKKELKSAVKAQRRAAWKNMGFGRTAIANYESANKRTQVADMKALNAKAKYNASKHTDKRKADKAEFNTYRKAMQKTGLRNSAMDKTYGGRSVRIYNAAAKRKGKDYADRVEKSVQNHAIAVIAASAAVYVGGNITLAYANSKY